MLAWRVTVVLARPGCRNFSHTFVRNQGPITKYKEWVKEGVLRPDDHQERIVEKLQALHDKIKEYNPAPLPAPVDTKPTSLFSRMFNRRDTGNDNRLVSYGPDGLYLYGDVGTGKTMVMDLFYDTLPPTVEVEGFGKRRVHFHAFMIDVHKRIHKLKTEHGVDGIEDPIASVARDLAGGARILCFDEFQVTDIVDAMILRRLFECLLEYGVVCVITSNRHPDELYKNGIQRESFIPAIELIKKHFDVTDLNSHTDYRKIPRALSKVYFHPINDENRIELDKIFHSLVGDERIQRDRHISVWGRTLRIPESTISGIARFSFEDLCGKPLSAPDYLEISKHFHTIFITDVPKMGLRVKDKARRFIKLIDAFYESRTKLFALSEAPVHLIFGEEQLEPDGSDPHISDHMRSIMDDLGLPDATAVAASSMFSGEEELFSFARASSRLVQMGTKDWAMTSGHE